MSLRTVVIAIGSLQGGGSERTNLSLARGLIALGCDVHLVLTRGGGDWTPEGITSDRVHTLQGDEEGPAVRRLCAEVEADLVVTNRPAVIREEPGPRTLCTVHNTPTSRSRRLSFWRRRRKMRDLRELYEDKHLIAQSQGMAEDLIQGVHIRPASLKVIENPFELAAIRRAAATGLPADAPPGYILHVGSFQRYKRHDTLIEAYARSSLDLPLVLLGKDMGDGSGERRVRRFLARHRLEGSVQMRGFEPDVYPWISRARLLVLSSESEGLPRALVEARILGTPVASTDCASGPREILTGDSSRFLAPVGDARSLARAMVAALADPPAIASAQVERFSHVNVARRFLKAGGLDPAW